MYQYARHEFIKKAKMKKQKYGHQPKFEFNRFILKNFSRQIGNVHISQMSFQNIAYIDLLKLRDDHQLYLDLKIIAAES